MTRNPTLHLLAAASLAVVLAVGCTPPPTKVQCDNWHYITGYERTDALNWGLKSHTVCILSDSKIDRPSGNAR